MTGRQLPLRPSKGKRVLPETGVTAVPLQAGTLGLPTSPANTPQPGFGRVDAVENPTLLSARAAGCSLNTYALR